MSTSHLALLRRGAALAVAATAVFAPAAHAAGPPVITGLSSVYFLNSVTISGSGFTGADAVRVDGATTQSFTVTSDHTIKAVIAASPGSGGTAMVHVSANGQTSADTLLAKTYQSPFYGDNQAEVPVQCTIGGVAGGSFAAALVENFIYDGRDLPLRQGDVLPEPYTPRTNSTTELGAFRASLRIAEPATVLGPLAHLLDTAEVTSVVADVTGAADASIDLASAAAPPYSFPVASSVDGNPLQFLVAELPGVQLRELATPGPVRISLRGYHALVHPASGGTAPLDCVPSNPAQATLSSFNTLPPAPKITSLSATSAPTFPGSAPGNAPTTIHVFGSGLSVGSRSVSIATTDDRGSVRSAVGVVGITQISDSELELTLPPHGAGPVQLIVRTAGGTTQVPFTFVGSTPLTTQVFAAGTTTCTTSSVFVADPAVIAHAEVSVTADLQTSLLPSEPVAANNTIVSLAFHGDDIDWLRYMGSPGFRDLVVGFGGLNAPHDIPSILWDSGSGLSADGSTYTLKFRLGTQAMGVAPANVGSTTDAVIQSLGFSGPGANNIIANCTLPSAHVLQVPVVAPPTPSPTPSPSPTPDPTPAPAPAAVNLALKGSATLKTLAKGNVPLAGSLKGSITQGAFAGDLALDPTTANLVALGFLQVQAKLAFVQVTPTTGMLSAAGALATSTKVRIKLPSIKLFGLELVGAGSTCQAANPTILGLKSPAFTAAGGGSLTGAFAISNLTGCGALTGIVSPLTAGGSNAIALSATPAATPAAG